MQTVQMPQLPKALRPDDTYTHEDACCTLLCDYVIHRYGSDEEAPEVEIISILADFGGREQVNVPLNSISGFRLLELEAMVSAEVEHGERAKGADRFNHEDDR